MDYVEIEGFTYSNGEWFRTKEETLKREEFLSFEKAVNTLPHKEVDTFFSITQPDATVENAYYISSKKEYEQVCNYLAHPEKAGYRKREWTKTNFKGPNWYLFYYYEGDYGPHKYWTETLSEQKETMDSYFNSFQN